MTWLVLGGHLESVPRLHQDQRRPPARVGDLGPPPAGLTAGELRPLCPVERTWPLISWQRPLSWTCRRAEERAGLGFQHPLAHLPRRAGIVFMAHLLPRLVGAWVHLQQPGRGAVPPSRAGLCVSQGTTMVAGPRRATRSQRSRPVFSGRRPVLSRAQDVPGDSGPPGSCQSGKTSYVAPLQCGEACWGACGREGSSWPSMDWDGRAGRTHCAREQGGPRAGPQQTPPTPSWAGPGEAQSLPCWSLQQGPCPRGGSRSRRSSSGHQETGQQRCPQEGPLDLAEGGGQ